MTELAIRFQKEGVLPAQKMASKVWSGVRGELSALPIVFTSLKTVAYCSLVREGGPAGRNWFGDLMDQGTMVATWGRAPGLKSGGVGRHCPMSSPPRKGGWGDAYPSVLRQVRISAATRSPN